MCVWTTQKCLKSRRWTERGGSATPTAGGESKYSGFELPLRALRQSKSHEGVGVMERKENCVIDDRILERNSVR
jgi:hypothetical protein